MRKITLADIAKKTGYSVNTVSHALRDMKDISKEVKSYINDTAKKMGYIPNISAGFLRGGKTMSVAVIIKDMADVTTANIIKSIEYTLSKKGYSMFVMNTDSDEKEERSAITRALSQNVDGIIISPALRTNSSIKFLKESSTQFLLLGAELRGAVSVSLDIKGSLNIEKEHLSKSNYTLGTEAATTILDMIDGKEVSSKIISTELSEEENVVESSKNSARASRRQLSDYLL